jgi:hypothetical protein
MKDVRDSFKARQCHGRNSGKNLPIYEMLATARRFSAADVLQCSTWLLGGLGSDLMAKKFNPGDPENAFSPVLAESLKKLLQMCRWWSSRLS